jgi:lysophospholipase L1-like esterase
MKRTLRICLALLLALGILYAARKPLNLRYVKQKAIPRHWFAQTFVGTRIGDSAWAHRLLSSYANLPHYQAANRQLPPATGDRVIFYGDSITDRWLSLYPQEFFPGKLYLDRGITGQSTPELVWRFQQDVLDLHPATVVILAGTNDIILTDRHIPRADTTRNLQTMAEAALRHKIRVILCSIPPVTGHPEPAETLFTQQIQSLNIWLRAYAIQHHLTYIDYYTPMSTPTGALQPNLTNDGTHPNANGYAIMQPLAQEAVNTP